ncbi:hypothetical protein [Salinimicrobium soli]|uniref:hypothetical protein n=1 Tax=Salinimicrobium soli TaxID=1254399 RepID=UPI003AAF255C
MRKFKIILGIFSLLAVTLSCSLEDGIDQDTSFINSANIDNIGAILKITNDNSGVVTVTPTGEGATTFVVDFGDGEPVSDEIGVGESVNHTYAEGNYDIVVTGTNLAGKTAQGIQPVVVSFRQPENLTVNVQKDPQDNYTINVSASADYAAMFEVYFGEEDGEEPTPLMIGGTVSHTYETIGAYDLRVVALSGGEASLETTQVVTITDPLFLPVDFESSKLDYSWIGFGGSNAQVINNPDMSGLNTSAKVVELTKDAGAQSWAGATLELDEPLDFSQGTAIKMNVWSPEAGVPIMVKIEDSNSAPDQFGNPSVFVEVTEFTTTSNQWEEMTFNLKSSSSFDPSVNYDNFIVFYDFGSTGEGTTVYLDDIRLAKLQLLSLPITFESDILTYSFYNFGPDQPNGVPIVDNPDPNYINMSNKVAKYTKPSGSQTWAGTFLELDERIDFSTKKYIQVDVWSPTAGTPVLLKVENKVNGNLSAEKEVNTTVSGEWETLTFDLTGVDTAVDYNKIVMFFNMNTSGTGETYYFDNIRTVDPNLLALPLTFESDVLDYSFFNFGPDVENGVPIIANPDPSGVNTSDMVAEYTKPSGSQVWAGTFLVLDEAIDFSSQQKVRVDVWSPIAGAEVLLKIENSADNSIFVETRVNTTVSGQWETLTFDLSNVDPSKVYDKVVLFFNMDTSGTGETYYFDNIYLTN